MGKEWYGVRKSSKRSVIVEGNETTPSPPSGCMCAFFQFFDFHPFHFPNTINHQQEITSSSCISKEHTLGAGSRTNFLQVEKRNSQPSDFSGERLSKEHTTTTSVSKGAEAPRNSLKSEDSIVSASLSKEENLKIPNIQIKTKRSNGGNLTDLSSEISTSPGTKTPTLVARLMGLDLLPNPNSPSFSSPLSTPNSQGKNNIIQHLHQVRTKQQQFQTKARNSIDSSEITRMSSSRKTEFDHHRLSLQINKENNIGGEDFELPRFSFSKRKIDENSYKSSNHYAKQIVKQVKESVVSRKVGQDITNTLKSNQVIGIQQNSNEPDYLPRKDQLLTREEVLGQLRIKRCPKTTSLKDSNPISSCSPRIRFIENKHKPNTTTDQNTKPKAYTLKEEQESSDKKLVSKCKKDANEKFSSRFKRLPKTSDINISSTSNSRANDIRSNTKSKRISNVLSIGTESSYLANKIPLKQSQVSETQDSKLCPQLSSCSRQRYKQEGTVTLSNQEPSTKVIEDKFNGATTLETNQPEFQYITEILNKHGTITTTKNVSFNKWFSSTHLLDPSIFHHLEQSTNDNIIIKNQLCHRWNRKLLFDLVDEVLIEILKPNGGEKRLYFLDGFCDQWTITELTERVLKRVVEFPCAKCEVLDDIDNLIEGEDMEKLIKVEDEEEREGLVMEIQGNILDTLVHETILIFQIMGTI
ncbi:uncharacterized protein [Medicago truncatula]|uniref:uncharacterized protein isoform X2 n=1 Tax=Medicago truncatula TaxID=3880 RepID=UPI0019681EFF|nr:uncharacterized protein LOC11427611 isoform X2 [Medicago truncatula]